MKKVKWFLNHHEYTIFVIAFVIIVLGWVAGYFWEWAIIPPEKFVKIAFSIIGVSIGGGVCWIWLNVIPQFKEPLDPDTKYTESEKLTRWQKTQIGFGFYALFLICFTLILIFA